MEWIPPDMAAVCQANDQLTSCSAAGYMFIAFVTQLFGTSPDNKYSKFNKETGRKQSTFPIPHIGPTFILPTTVDIPKFEIALPINEGVVFNSEKPKLETVQISKVVHNLNPSNKEIQTYRDSSGSGGLKSSFFDKPFESPFDTLNSERESISAQRFTDGAVTGLADIQEHVTNAAKFGDTFFKSFGDLNFPNDGHTFALSIDEGFESVEEGNFKRFDDFHSKYFGDNFFKISDIGKSSMNAQKKPKLRREKRGEHKEEFDFIIVGAGSAGCVLANRLSEVKSWKVLLLEAGPEEPEVTGVPALAPVLARSSVDWQYRMQPEKTSCKAHVGQSCISIRGRVMGGSSALNYMVYMRGNRRDYDEWVEMGNPGWSYDEVLPYFKKSEHNNDAESHDHVYHSRKGYLNVERFPYFDKNVFMIVDGFRETGLPITDLNADTQIGTMVAQSTSKNGLRVSTNVAFIRPIRSRRPNLVVRPLSQVHKILIDASTKIAYGVEYEELGKRRVAFARKEIISSAGAINSPKLLMLSGIGPKKHLAEAGIKILHDLKVGYNYQDHVTFDAMLASLTNATSTLIDSDELAEELYTFKKLVKKQGPLASTGALNACAFIKTENEEEPGDVPDIQYHFNGRNFNEFMSDPTNYLASNIMPLSFYDSINPRPILLKPRSRGYIALNLTDPVYGPPLIVPRFFSEAKDIQTMLSGIRFALSLENTIAFKSKGVRFARHPFPACVDYLWGSDAYWVCAMMGYTNTIFHPSGTCKMGPSWDKTAVVNPTLKVYGIQNLRVIDASIMPTIVRANTNAPVIMIAEKAADLIKFEWLKS